MTRNEALELANKFYTNGVSEREVAFARFIAAAEREACAKVCENQPSPLLEPLTMYTGSEAAKVVLNSRKYLAAAIRARGQA